MKTYEELQAENERLVAERDALAAELLKLCEFRDDFVAVMNESSGVAGWHKNHAVATWDELFPVVPYFESPQQCLREIQAEAARNGFIAGYDAGHEYRFSNLGDELAEEYAEKVRNGE